MKLYNVRFLLVFAIVLFASCPNDDETPRTPHTQWNATYNIGDIGPGGGKIFYRSEIGFIMTDTNETCHYLEVTTTDLDNGICWSSPAFIPSNFGGTYDGWWVSIEGTKEAIGTGRKNTAIILAYDVNAPAAKICNDYSNNDKNDWFLPSIGELYQLRLNKDSIDNNWATSHWSSTLYKQTITSIGMNGAVRVLQIDYLYEDGVGTSESGSPIVITNAANFYTSVRAIRAF